MGLTEEQPQVEAWPAEQMALIKETVGDAADPIDALLKADFSVPAPATFVAPSRQHKQEQHPAAKKTIRTKPTVAELEVSPLSARVRQKCA